MPGKLYNIEATSGGRFARDLWMRQQMPMTDEAIQSGIYMRPLSKKEAVVEMTSTVLEYYGANGIQQPRIELAMLGLRHAPKQPTAISTSPPPIRAWPATRTTATSSTRAPSR